jgi:hypothetical protein
VRVALGGDDVGTWITRMATRAGWGRPISGTGRRPRLSTPTLGRCASTCRGTGRLVRAASRSEPRCFYVLSRPCLERVARLDAAGHLTPDDRRTVDAQRTWSAHFAGAVRSTRPWRAQLGGCLQRAAPPRRSPRHSHHNHPGQATAQTGKRPLVTSSHGLRRSEPVSPVNIY